MAIVLAAAFFWIGVVVLGHPSVQLKAWNTVVDLIVWLDLRNGQAYSRKARRIERLFLWAVSHRNKYQKD